MRQFIIKVLWMGVQSAVTALIIVVLTQSPAAAQAGSNESLLAGLSPEETLDLVLTELEAREAATFRNLNIVYVEEVRVIAKPEVMRRSNYSIKWMSEGYLIEVKENNLLEVEDVTDHQVYSGDGVQEVNTSLHPKRPPIATKKSGRPFLLPNSFFLHSFGMRVANAGSLVNRKLVRVNQTLSEYVRSQKQLKDVAVSAAEDGQDVRLIIDAPEQRSTYWLSPKRGWMTSRFMWEGGLRGKPAAAKEEHEVIQANEVDGHWLPWVVEKRVPNLRNKSVQVSTAKVEEAALGELKPMDLMYQIPTAADIFEPDASVAYRLNDKGEREYLPVFDAGKGTVTVNGEPVKK